MSRNDEFHGAHARSRNHAGVTYGELRKLAPRKSKALDVSLFLRSREGGYRLSTNPALHISWEEHQKRERERDLEENG